VDAVIRGQLLSNTSLAAYTSWRVGGPADRLYLPADLDDLINFLKTLPNNEPITCLGLGSNVLIHDSGIRGTVIVMQKGLTKLEQINETTIRAEAGVACPALARFSARLSLEGAEFLAGIPGTVGGALAMNAGCHGGETWDCVTAVETVDRQGDVHTRYPNEYEISYRNVKPSPVSEFFIAAHFKLNIGNKEHALEKIRELLAYRTKTQPTSEPNCGSVFRNPPNDYAARLIEACNLKGKKIGGASVSTKHANFIVNDGSATAKDIETLIDLIAAEVQRVHGIKLVREVHVLVSK
jgi:UDP-N-acetylmuramate dehydrogenase